MLPLLVDGLGNTLHLWNSPGWLRGLTGLGVGLSVPWLLAPLAFDTEHAAAPSLQNLRPLGWPALIGVLAVASLACDLGPIPFRVLAVAAAAGWFAFVFHFLYALVRSYGETLTRKITTFVFRFGVRT
jgi:hypothetical protein